jgi:hypothetical protein
MSRQAIRTKYHGPSNVRGSRIGATCAARQIFVHYDDGLNLEENHIAAAKELQTRLGWKFELVTGVLEDGSHAHVFHEPKLPSVRFIIDTYCSLPQRATGNVDRWARITSTVSGRTLCVSTVGGSQNIPHAVYNALDPERPGNFDVWSWMHYGEHDIPRSLFRQPENGVYEGDLTPEMILQLEQPA